MRIGKKTVATVFLLFALSGLFGVMDMDGGLSGGGSAERATAARAGEKVSMAFFYDPDCPCSQEIIDDLLPPLENNFTFLNTVWYDVTTEVGEELAEDFQNAYNVPYKTRLDYPFFFVGDEYLSYEQMNYSAAAELIKGYSGMEVPLWPEWNVTWITEAAFFHDSGDPYLAKTGESAFNIVTRSEGSHLRLYVYDLNGSEDNATLLDRFLDEYNATVEYVSAALFIGNGTDHLIDGEIESKTINATLQRYEGTFTPLKTVTLPEEERPETPNEICVLIFYSPTCGECHKALDFIHRMEEKYPRLRVKRYSTSDRDNEALKQSGFEQYGVPKWKRGALGVFIGDKVFYDYEDLEEGFEDEIEKYPDGVACPEIEEDDAPLVDTFMDIEIIGVIIAGLIDGINPCAFVTLIFFISYLTLQKGSKKDVLMVGGSFTVGVFVTYLLMGIGLYRLVGYVESIHVLSTLLYPLTGLVALIFGIYSLYDYFKVKKGSPEKMALQMPKSVKKFTRKTIRWTVKTKYLSIVAAFTGVLIALCEFMCTGQVYLPTIVYIFAMPGYRARAFFYLLVYNLMFILPLIVIFISVYYGATSRKLTSMFRKRLGLIKILMALLFFGLAAFMFIYSFW